MKNENELNSELSKEFKRREPKIKSVKTSDRISVGISDFTLYGNGLSCALEVKFVKELPARDNSAILGHKFDGAQITHLESIWLTGNNAFGLIGVLPEKMMYLFDMTNCPANDRMEFFNFKKEDLRSHYFTKIPFGSIDELLTLLLTRRQQ